jgi:hypothetical protein
MRLPRQQAFALLLVAAIGCNDSIGPKLPATFDLVNINGRGLPTFLSPTPGLTPTILFASLTLDNNGKAFWLEARREFDGTQTTINYTFDYRITFNQIEIGSFSPCPDNANCVGTYKGTISNEALSLNVQATDAGAIIYNYRKSVGNYRKSVGLTPY